ncbi:hypothetical protein ACH4T9_16110 [Micromonospora sp. NPDC020750]|uniref:hypothetical protein n=1 Tax=unclassified Micromonospora TaxID=2617518 RepID=UPI0037BB7EF1
MIFAIIVSLQRAGTPPALIGVASVVSLAATSAAALAPGPAGLLLARFSSGTAC